MSSSAQIATLLEQTGWIRSLARNLVADAHMADDLVQEAWVAALERPPAAERSVRGWIATLLRHRVRDLRRERGHREERERSAARHEALPSAHELVEKASIQRKLVAAVVELDEPYRTTVLLRFFEELPQREIARRMQTSTATVNSRLTRALDKLRERLSREGGRSAWLQVLVPLLKEPAVAPLAALGVSAMKTSAIAVVFASVLVGFALWRASGEKDTTESRFAALTNSTPMRPPAADASSPSVQLPAVPVDERAEVGVAAVEAPAPERAANIEPSRIVRGRVLDVSGIGVSGVALVLASQERTTTLDSKARCTSDASGAFEIQLDAPAEMIVSADPRYATVLAGSARVRGETQPSVVVAPRVELAGIVVDEDGSPLAGAHVSIRLPAGLGTEWGFALDYSVPQRWLARSAEDGRFEIGSAPALAGATVHAMLGGYEEHIESAPARSDSALEIVLTHPKAAEGLVRGVVLDPSGSEVEGARVSAGGQVAVTGRDGEFALDVASEGTLPQLLAVQRGYLPARFDPERDPKGAVRWPGYVVLQLGGAPASFHGRVLDADGRPVANAKVWLDDPTHFGRITELGVSAEALLSGDERFWSYQITRADGSFAIDGLLPRAYRLQAVDPRTLASAESAPVTAASSPVELVLPTHDVYERIAGRVVTDKGEPISKVAVRPCRVTFELHHEHGTDNDCEEREPVITGDDGAFEFFSVPRSGVDLIATGDTILSSASELSKERDREHIEIVASLRLHVQVELDEPRNRADRLRIFDAEGKRVILSVFHGGGSLADWQLPILDGRSEVLSVDSSAAVVVLYRGEEEVARIPLHLALGGTNVVRY